MASRSKRKLNREQERDLDIEIGFLAGLTRRDPSYVDALAVLGDDYVLRGRFNDGLKVDQQIARLRPGDPRVLYNLACSYALNANHEAAFEELNRALDAGYRDFRWLSRDPDLATFRKHPLYRRLRQRVRSLQVAIE